MSAKTTRYRCARRMNRLMRFFGPKPHEVRVLNVTKVGVMETLEQRTLMSATLFELDALVLPDSTQEIEGAGAGSDLHAPLMPLGETFSLNSNAGASHTIFLDFDGHTTSGTIWNSNFNGGADIVTAAFSLDSDTGSFTDSELTRIQTIWQRVAEDFSPFDVNVTTEDPGAAALSISSSSDSDWGVRVVVGGSNTDWYGAGGGVAYIGSFNWASDSPAFVFENQMGNGNEKYTAEAISHEVGHTLGLNHDGNASTGYYSGHGSGETGWAPIMGVGYYKSLSQWNSGEYAGANNLQDDLSIITSNNGFGYRVDDHGGDWASATELTDALNLEAYGIIERNTDYDVFSFHAGDGAVDIVVDPYQRGANLDVLAELYDATNQLIASSNPLSLLSATISATLTAGEYYLRVTGTGMGDPLNGGYSDYGSLGQYTVMGSAAMPDSPPPPTIPGMSIGDVTVDEGAGSATFTVTLSEAASELVSVDFATGDGSATVAGGDYQASNGTLVFNAGQLTQTITVSLNDDLMDELDESFVVGLFNVGGATLMDAEGIGTIVDNDEATPPPAPMPEISITDAVRYEPDLGKGKNSYKTTGMTFTVSLSSASDSVVSVDFGTMDGTATLSDSDYESMSGNVVFNPGEMTKTITVQIVGDNDVESNERFTIELSNAVGGDLVDGIGVGLIVNEDSESTADTGGTKKKGRRAAVVEVMAQSYDFDFGKMEVMRGFDMGSAWGDFFAGGGEGESDGDGDRVIDILELAASPRK